MKTITNVQRLMRNDFEKLLWMYSMGLKDVASRQPINYQNVQLKKIIKESFKKKLNTSNKSQEIRTPEDKKTVIENIKRDQPKSRNFQANSHRVQKL